VQDSRLLTQMIAEADAPSLINKLLSKLGQGMLQSTRIVSTGTELLLRLDAVFNGFEPATRARDRDREQADGQTGRR
jgi:hypothetical protein